MSGIRLSTSGIRLATELERTRASLAGMRKKVLALQHAEEAMRAKCEAIARDHNARGLPWAIADAIAALKDKP